MAAQPPSIESPFADARGCKAWLGALPLANVPLAQSQVQEALANLPAAVPDAFERLKCLELMRDRVAFLQGEQQARVTGKPVPLSPGDERAWHAGLTLAAAMESAYRRVFAEALASAGDLRRLAGLAAQRAIRYLGAQVALHLSVHRRFEPALGARLNKLYAEAEAAQLADERVKDSLEGYEGVSTVAEAYVQVLLELAATPFELTPAQREFVASVAHIWARKVPLRRAVPEETLPPALHPLVVDLESSAGAVALAPRAVTAHHRVLDTLGLSRSIRRRIQGLRSGEDVTQLKLPVQASGVDLVAMLERLHRAWCEVPAQRAAARAPDVSSADVVLGVPGVYFFITGGKPFEAPDRSRELTSQEKQEIEVFGRVSTRTQQLRASEMVLAKSEGWDVVEEQLGAWRLRRAAKGTHTVAVGRLVAMRVGETAPFFLGTISEVAQEPDGALGMAVTLFPGKPEPIAVRADSRGRAPGKWQEGFRLPAVPRLGIPVSLVVPAGVAQRGRGVEAWEGGARLLEVATILDHGTDFDRVALA